MAQSLLEEVTARLGVMKPEERQEIVEATKDAIWVPLPGPQTEAYLCLADLLLFGGQAGPGKSDVLLGLAHTQQQRSLIMRRQYTDMGALIERALEINGTRDGFNGSPPPKLRTQDGRLIEFGAASKPGDEHHWQGQPHDFLGLDEVVQFLESQIRFVMGWVRTTNPKQRCRVVFASNPPITAEGDWIIGMFRPWLDPTHPNPAESGELRWYLTDPDGKDMEVDGPDDAREWDNRVYLPKSRTFIPGGLQDNPYLLKTGYQSTLDALPEPIRSAVRDGNFMAAKKDRAFQVIPTMWVIQAQQRWQERPPVGVPMCAMGVDPAIGGPNEFVIAPRYDGWYAPLIAVPGREIEKPSDGAAEVVKHRRDEAHVVVDMGGGYGGGVRERLAENGVEAIKYLGASDSVARTSDGSLKFSNKRSESYWRFREALDPDQEHGSNICLPDDPGLVADLTAPDFRITSRGIQITPKEDLVKELGRSTDRGDAVIMAWTTGRTHITGQVAYEMGLPDQRVGGRTGRTPKIDLGRRRKR